MANINSRNIPDDLYHRVRLAAANGAPRLPKGALERFVNRALRRAVEDPQPGAGMPKIKLCAHCLKENLARMGAPKANVVPPSNYETGEVTVSTEKKAPVALFSHLLGDDISAAAAVGMMGDEDQIVRGPAPSAHFYADNPRSLATQLEDAGATEVMGGLWVGSDQAFRLLPPGIDAWAPLHPDLPLSVLSAAKYPWHKSMVGYLTKSAPEGPERLVARRGNHMALNLIDVRELGPGGAHYVPDEVITAALDFIHERLAARDQVLVHCNAGKSRAPTIAFLYMQGEATLPISQPEAVQAFREAYPLWEPSAGMAKYLELKGVADACRNLGSQ